MIARRLQELWSQGRKEEALREAADAAGDDRLDAADALAALGARDGSPAGRAAADTAAALRAAPWPAGSAPAIEAELAVADWCLAHGRIGEGRTILARVADTLEALTPPAPDATSAALYRLALLHRRTGDAAAEEATWRRALAYGARVSPDLVGSITYPRGELNALLRRQGRPEEG